MEVRLLGAVELDGAAGTVAIGSSKQRALLALLALQPNRFVAVDTLLERLWGEEPPEGGVKSLRFHVSKLRQALRDAGSPDALATRTGGYTLVIDKENVDAGRFEQLLGKGRIALSAGDPPQASTLLRQAVALWRGPPLADVGDAPFADRERRRLHELWVEANEALFTAELATGRHAAIIGELEHMVELEPLREQLWEQLITALYRSGRQAEALAAYQRVRVILTEQLGIDPSPSLRALERQVLLHDEHLAARPAAAEPVLAGHTRRSGPAAATDVHRSRHGGRHLHPRSRPSNGTAASPGEPPTGTSRPGAGGSTPRSGKAAKRRIALIAVGVIASVGAVVTAAASIAGSGDDGERTQTDDTGESSGPDRFLFDRGNVPVDYETVTESPLSKLAPLLTDCYGEQGRRVATDIRIDLESLVYSQPSTFKSIGSRVATFGTVESAARAMRAFDSQAGRECAAETGLEAATRGPNPALITGPEAPRTTVERLTPRQWPGDEAGYTRSIIHLTNPATSAPYMLVFDWVLLRVGDTIVFALFGQEAAPFPSAEMDALIERLLSG